jgi:ribonuclease HI
MNSNTNTIKQLNPLKIGKSYVKKDAKIFPISEYVMNFDGSSKGNPGLAGAGVVIYKNNQEYWSTCKFVGYKTNNQSEYSALIIGLKEALNQGIDTLCVYGDSLLVINQINGLFCVKSPLLVELYNEAIELKKQFKYIEFNHVYRENNKRADELSNLALENINSKEHAVYLTEKSASPSVSASAIEDTMITELDEDWVEEIKLDDQGQTRPKNPTKTNLFVKIPSATPKAKSKKEKEGKPNKQLIITEFFKINSLFPDIKS